MRSLKFLCGDDKFDDGVKKYIQEDVSGEEAFGNCFRKSDEAHQFFETWGENPGYPVVHVASHKDAHYNLTQERFLWFGKNKNEKWGIPIEYSEENTWKKDWLPKNENISLNINASYFTLNKQYQGFFRVNYDGKVWNALISQLKSCHSKINETHRAQLLDDVFSFPRSTFNFSRPSPTYVTALELSEYLKNETDYLPLKTAFNAFSFIDSALNGSLHGDFRNHVKGILSELYKKFGLKSNHSDTLLVNEVSSWACKFGVEKCVKDADEIFNKFMTPFSNPLPELSRIALCSVFRNDVQNLAIFEAMMNGVNPESADFIYLVGCIRDRAILSVFLFQFIQPGNKDKFMMTLHSVMENNPDNINTTLSIVDNLKSKIVQVFGDEFLENIVRLALPKLNVESAKTLQNIVKHTKNQKLQTLVNELEENVKLWSDKKAPSIKDYIEQKPGSGSQAKPVALIILVSTLLPFVNHVFNS